MSDLAEELRDLIDGSAPPVTLEEIGRARAAMLEAPSKIDPVVRSSLRGHPKRTVLVVAVAVIVIGAVAWVANALENRSSQRTVTPTVRIAANEWKLTADLSGPQFVVATGNPNAVVGVTCGTSKTCFLSTGYGLDYSGGGGMSVSHDDGRTWQPTTLPSDTAITTLVSCASSTWCASGSGRLDPATGDPAAKKPSRDPELIVTADGGATWTSKPVPIPVDVQQLPAYQNLPAETTYWPGQIDAVSCQAPGVCNVVGHTQVSAPNGGTADELVFLRTTDGGAHWTTSILPEQSSETSFQVTMASGESVSMACPTTNDCVVVGNLFSIYNPSRGVVDTWRTNDAGQTWHENRVPNVFGLTSGVTCPDTANCWMIPQASPDPGTGKYPLLGNFLHSADGGVTWKPVPPPILATPGLPTPVAGWDSISCVSNKICYVGGAEIAETSDGGASWRKVSLPSQVGGVLAISCNEDQSCVALGKACDPVGQLRQRGIADPHEQLPCRWKSRLDADSTIMRPSDRLDIATYQLSGGQAPVSLSQR